MTNSSPDRLEVHNVGVIGRPGRWNVRVESGLVVQLRPADCAEPFGAERFGAEPFGAEPSDAERIDASDLFLMPGLWDHHVHFTEAVCQPDLDLSRCESAREAADAVAAHVRGRPAASSDHTANPTSTVVRGRGFKAGMWPDRPHRQVLDERIPDPPVVLTSNDLHSMWLNTAALRLLGMEHSHPDGIVLEDECPPVNDRLALSSTEVDGLLAAATVAIARRGIVGVVDLEVADNPSEWARRAAAAVPSVRVVCGVWEQHLESTIAAGLRTGDVLPGTGGRVQMGMLKVITDGSLGTQTALCHQRYPDRADDEYPFGLHLVPPARLVPLMQRATESGLACAIHAIGDAANTLALDAFEQTGARGTIEHAQLLVDSDFRRFAELGVAASVQPYHAIDDRDIAERYWSGRTGDAFAYRSLLDAGAELRLGSDAPVAPLDPWVTIGAAVHRSGDRREPWHPEQHLTMSEALAASCNQVSTISEGMVADLVLIDRDPHTVEPGRLAELMDVVGTMIAGDWTWRDSVLSGR